MGATTSRPSLLRPGMFSITWHTCTWIGGLLVIWSLLELSHGAIPAMGAPFLMTAAIVVISELRPIVMSRLEGNPVSISLAFVFAAMYIWGIAPAIVLVTASVVISELLQRKPMWKLFFNIGQYVISIGGAWLVMVAAGVTPSPTSPHTDFSGADLGWIVGTWIVYHLLNLALVAGVAAGHTQTWWESFTEEFWFYTISVAAVLALSPLIAIVAVATPGSWMLLPLLLLPLVAVQKAAEMSREKEHQALHDPLTGLPNRILLADRIDQALARSTRQAGRVTVLFLDVDLFKVVNDSLGHAAGDELLIEMSHRLSSVLRPGDTLARFGGDEFVIVCEDVPPHEVERISDRITYALREPFVFESRSVNVSTSIGIAVASQHTDAATMLRDADAAMYRAKAGGRNQAVVFDEEMHDQAAARLEAELGLRRALQNGELRLQYQPIVEAGTERIAGVEALVRWQHPEFGLLPPDRFISMAEETGLILPLGNWVLEQALAQVEMWRETVPGAEDLWVAVNMSARQLRSPELVGVLQDALEASRIPASSVHLEITESVIMDEVGPHVETMAGLRSLGVDIAIDDFGTGYSSLGYLRSLPVTSLKIDRSFVSGLGLDDAAATAIIDAIVGVARALHLDVIAEGVEQPEQLDMLRGLSVRYGQGYLWSPPIDAGDMAAWIRARAVASVA